MLPFLQPKKAASVIMAARKKDGTAKPDEHEGAENSKLMPLAEKLISAVHAKDAAAVVAVFEALQAIDEELDEAAEEAEES